jgi:predicted transcriptional regulator of viral defense system
MNFLEFKSVFKDYLVFSVSDAEKMIPGFNKMNLVNWQKKGYIKKLRNSYYCFADLVLTKPDLYYIANKIYKPSYISLESALCHYGVIPEVTVLIQSISSMKTNLFKNALGSFHYNHLKPGVFLGYTLYKNNDKTIKIADPEKALLDLFYLKSTIRSVEDLKALRLNKIILKEIIDFNKLFQYSKEFKSKLLFKKTDLLKRYTDA